MAIFIGEIKQAKHELIFFSVKFIAKFSYLEGISSSRG